MTYKLIALDLDDTLLLPDATLHPKTIEAINQAQEKGVHIVLASGRPTKGMLKIAELLNLSNENDYILSFNGACIHRYGTMELLYSQFITKKQFIRLHEISKNYNVDMLTYLDDEILVTKSSQYAVNETGFANMPMRITENISSELPDTIPKAMFLGEPTHLAEVEKAVTPMVSDELFTTISKPYFYEFMNKAVDKGASLLRLGEMIGVHRDEMIAVGDSYNDLTMIEAAGLGVAMANAVDEVKNKAQMITLSNEENGVAEVIKKMILNA